MNRRRFLATAGLVGTAGAAWSAPRVERDLVYSEPDGEKLTLDLYLPDGPGPHPAVVLVHGGGWLGGSKDGYREAGPRLARHGFAACAINYRLAPRFPYPAAMDDCHQAVRWVRANAPQYGVDGERVAAMGDSAGGHLVALIGVRDARRGVGTLTRLRSRPDAVVANYGAHELVRMWKIEMARRPLTAWLGGPPEDHASAYREASPVAMARPGAPPFLIVHGDQDTVNPLEQSQLLHQALRKQTVESTLLILPGAGHGWPPDSDTGRAAEAATVEFLNRHLRRRR